MSDVAYLEEEPPSTSLRPMLGPIGPSWKKGDHLMRTINLKSALVAAALAVGALTATSIATTAPAQAHGFGFGGGFGHGWGRGYGGGYGYRYAAQLPRSRAA
jgi:hypothetical protein